MTLASSNATSIRWAWTTSGITPNCAAGTVYGGTPIPLSPSHESLRAVACNGAYASSVASFGYIIGGKTCSGAALAERRARRCRKCDSGAYIFL